MRQPFAQKLLALLGRIPGVLETYWWLQYLRRQRFPYWGRWNRLREWFLDLEDSVPVDPPCHPRRLLMFSTLPYWIDLSLAIAVVLIGYGHRVDFAWLRHSRWQPYESEGVRRAEERYSTWSQTFPAPEHPRLRLYDITDGPFVEPTESMLREASDQSRLDTQYVQQREEVDIGSNAEHTRTYHLRYSRNLDCMRALKYLLERDEYDLLITPNGMVLEFGAAHRLARLLNVPCITFEFTDRRGLILVSDTAPSVRMDTKRAWLADEPHRLSNERRRRMARFLENRGSGLWEGYLVRLQPDNSDPPRTVRETLGLGDGRPTALMCPNVAWDSAVLGRNVIFASMAEWLRETVGYFAKHPEWKLIVRVHPAEHIITTNQPVESIIHEQFYRLPANIILITPTESVNTYTLLDFAQVGLVYTSTVGMEMVAHGVPAIVAGEAHYRGKGFTVDPRDRDDYFDTLRQAMDSTSFMKPTTRQVELALCYLDVYFHQWPRPFPWHLATFRDDINEWPIGIVLGKDGETRFGDTFRLLSGREVVRNVSNYGTKETAAR